MTLNDSMFEGVLAVLVPLLEMWHGCPRCQVRWGITIFLCFNDTCSESRRWGGGGRDVGPFALVMTGRQCHCSRQTPQQLPVNVTDSRLRKAPSKKNNLDTEPQLRNGPF